MDDLTKKEMKKLAEEKQREKSRAATREHEERERQFRLEKEKRAKKKQKMIAVAVVLLLLFAALIAYMQFSPGNYDEFAKCLTEKGAVMYGEDWCPYTKGQKAMFGNSFKYVNYQVKKDLKIRPTWVINGNTYERVQSFERLSALTGCEI
jgi:predicted nucleotide-binding protein (sugar kinase/HSP70/actin superfamily)